MPENDETANAGEQDQTTEFKAPESQEELDRIIQKRIERERARFSDYADLKAKAEQLDEIEESKKSEIEKATARVAELEAKLAEAELSVLKADVAAAKGVPAKLLTGSTQEELEAAADELIEFRGEQNQAPRSSAFKDVSGEPVKGDTSSQFADFFNSKF